MNNSNLYPKLPTALSIEELDGSQNQSESPIIIETPVNCGKDNIPTCSNCCIQKQKSCAEESKTKDVRKQLIVKIASKTFYVFFTCLMGLFLLSLPFLIYALVKARDRTYWID